MAKRLASALIALALLLCAAPAALAFKNEPDGFRGVKFGDHVDSVPGLTLIGGKYQISYYTRQGDKNALRGARLEKVSYSFWDKRFIAAVLLGKGDDNWGKMVRACQNHWGPAIIQNMGNKLIWEGAKAVVILEIVSKKDEFSLYIASKTMEAQYKAAHKRSPRKKKKASDGF